MATLIANPHLTANAAAAIAMIAAIGLALYGAYLHVQFARVKIVRERLAELRRFDAEQERRRRLEEAYADLDRQRRLWADDPTLSWHLVEQDVSSLRGWRDGTNG